MSARRVVAGVGRTLIAVGVLLLLFVAYQLWGTGLAEAGHQHQLATQLHHELGGGDNPTVSPPTVPGASTTTTAAGGGLQPGVAPAEGQPVAFLSIPRIGLDQVVVVEGVGTDDLRLGPGHYPGTPLPGQPGNAAIAGHRTTYGAPFYNLDQLGSDLGAGRHDDITVTTAQGSFLYTVQSSQIVSPTDSAVLDTPAAGAAELTLTTCNPRYSASQRLVVQATLTGTPAPSPAPAPAPTGKRRTAPAAAVGLAGGQGGPWPPLGWGLGCLAVAVAGWWAARRFSGLRRLAVYGAAAVPFLVVLFFFYASLSPLLPASF